MAYEIFVILVPFVVMSTQGPKDLLFKVVHRAAGEVPIDQFASLVEGLSSTKK